MRRAGAAICVAALGAGFGVSRLAAQQPADVAVRPLSRFEESKALSLLRDRLPCLGCHRLNGEGGMIGPDLTAVAGRRPVSFIFGMIVNPQGTLPGSRMPKIPMPPAWAELIARYFAGRASSGPGAATPPPSAALRALAPAPGAQSLREIRDAGALYRELCAGCHGPTGRGDGFNAAHLPVRPTAHADSAAMSRRPDDTLFDGIYAGGYVLGRSPRMPAWGETLSREQIWGLVRYIRALCRCRGPAWSEDGSPERPRGSRR